MARDISKHEYEHLAEFRYAMRRFMEFSAKAAKSVGLTPLQHQALLVIKGFSGRDHVTVGELAEQLCTQHHSAVGLVDRMVAAGWVRREHNNDDRREVFIYLTRDGSRILQALTESHRDELTRVAPHLGQLISQLSAISVHDD